MFKVVAHPAERWAYAALGEAFSKSASEVHASVARAVTASLALARGRGDWSPVRPALLEFALHGARNVWPAVPGPVKRGVPTGFGGEPLASKINAASGEAPVWAHATGSAKGPSLSPIYRTAPQDALADSRLHRLLALQDALLAGCAHERALAAKSLPRELGADDAT